MNPPPSFLAALPPGAAERLVQAGSERSFEDGAVIVRQGGPSDAMYVLTDGLATVTVGTADGRAILLALLGPGDAIGELGILDGRPRSATVTARGAVTALRIDSDAVIELLRRTPDAALALLRTLATRLRRSDAVRTELALASTDVRLARRLLELAAAHGELTEGRILIDLGFSQSELAAWVGASRESVSEALRRFREDGLVETARQTITVLDLNGLRERALW